MAKKAYGDELREKSTSLKLTATLRNDLKDLALLRGQTVNDCAFRILESEILKHKAAIEQFRAARDSAFQNVDPTTDILADAV